MGRGPGVRPASESSIQIDFKYKRKRCRERIALPPTPANLKYAKRLKSVIDHEIATNTFDYAKHFPESPRARRFASRVSTELRTGLLAYCDSLSGQLEPETIAKYRNDAEIVAAGLKGKTFGELTRADIRDWVSTLNLSKKRIDNILTPLRGAFSQAVEDELIKENPIAGFKVRRVKEDRQDVIDPFTPKEIDELSKSELGHLWTFWAWTGLRTGEIIGLEWDDVETLCDGLTVRRSVRVGRTKSTKTTAGQRTLVLMQPARRALALLPRQSGPIFRNPNTGERWHEDRALARVFRRHCVACGVRYRYPYQLRHTFASWALSSGENPAWAAKYMGHKDMITFFKIYAKWMPSMAPDAGSKMVEATKSKAA